jgi:adenosylcobinamide amidohydrolase
MPIQIRCARPWLVGEFSNLQRIVSWSLNRPGFVDASTVAWLEVRDQELPTDRDPADWFRQMLAEADLEDAVGMMTARNVSTFVSNTARSEGVEAQCIVTLGLNNGEHVGRRIAPYGASPDRRAGTINILCQVSTPLTDGALLEASSIVAQARTVALVEAGYRRAGLAGSVTGTGTDCIVMAAPVGATPAAFAGMHTAIGETVGACVLDATRTALHGWLAGRLR